MDELLKVPACSNDHPACLRLACHKINVHIRGLGIESEQYGPLFIPSTMTKLSEDIKLRIAIRAG